MAERTVHTSSIGSLTFVSGDKPLQMARHPGSVCSTSWPAFNKSLHWWSSLTSYQMEAAFEIHTTSLKICPLCITGKSPEPRSVRSASVWWDGAKTHRIFWFPVFVSVNHRREGWSVNKSFKWYWEREKNRQGKQLESWHIDIFQETLISARFCFQNKCCKRAWQILQEKKIWNYV